MRNGSDDETVDHDNFFHRYAGSADRDFSAETPLKILNVAVQAVSPLHAALFTAHITS